MYTKEAKGNVNGEVIDNKGQPVSDAAVMITNGPNHYDIAALTDAEGHFSFNNLSPGSYIFKIKSARSSKTVDLVVNPAETKKVTIIL